MTLAIRTSEVRFVKRGDKGAKLRMRDWADNVSYLCGDQGEDFYDVVIYNTKLYLCLKSHTSSTANNPQTSVANNLGFWALATDWQFVATKLLLAEKITADQIDANNLVAKGVDITGKITATSGKIGGWEISGNNLTCSGYDTQLRVEASGTRFLRINYSPTSMLYLRAENSTGIKISTYGDDTTIGIDVLCNASGKGYAIRSYGNVLMTARSGELVKTVGHAVNMRYVSAATTLTTEDDLLVYTNSSDINVSVPSGNKYAGKILYMKKIGAGAVTLTGAYFKSQDSQTSTSYRISNSAPRIFIYDGSYWNEFYCGN